MHRNQSLFMYKDERVGLLYDFAFFPSPLFSILFGILFPLLGSIKIYFCRKSFVSFFKDFENAVGSEARCHSFYSLVTFFSVFLYSGQLLKII